MSDALPGINIQFPISELILEGTKTVETRTYPIPEKYINRWLYLVETPGTKGNFQSRVVALIRFGEPFLYKSKTAFYADAHRHRVDKDSPWRWNEKAKWGWPILEVRKVAATTLKQRPGIKFTKQIEL